MGICRVSPRGRPRQPLKIPNMHRLAKGILSDGRLPLPGGRDLVAPLKYINGTQDNRLPPPPFSPNPDIRE